MYVRGRAAHVQLRGGQVRQPASEPNKTYGSTHARQPTRTRRHAENVVTAQAGTPKARPPC
eukprot:9251067-Alexandrium_andersonii.AAC.1